MAKINEILNSFEPITLEEMERVKLMDRTDTKYAFAIRDLPPLLEEMRVSYACLRVQQTKTSNYRTLYYDTSDLALYTKHHKGELNRYKIRHRTYMDSDMGYLEVKFKNNKGRTIKERIKENTPENTFNKRAYTFLQSELPFDPSLLMPVVWVNYHRITLVNKVDSERLTIDINLKFKKGSTELDLTNLVIAEVKQEKRKTSPFIKAMKTRCIAEVSISKYCFAIAAMYSDVKKNNFKEKISSLNKLIKHDSIANSHRSYNG